MQKNFHALFLTVLFFIGGGIAFGQSDNSNAGGNGGGNSPSSSNNQVVIVDPFATPTPTPKPTPTPTPTEAQLLSTTSLSEIAAASNAALSKVGGVVIKPTVPGQAAKPAPGRPSSAFWYQPDAFKIVKVRGLASLGGTAGSSGQYEPLVPLLSWCQGYWQGPSTLGIKVDTTVPFSAGWGTNVPYDSVMKTIAPDTITYLKDIVVKSTNDLSGSLTDYPYEAGITRYEMWLAKKLQANGNWQMWSWFFDSYCVVNPGGSVIGKLEIVTSDANSTNSGSSIRTFRNSPYLVNSIEDTAFLRSYSTNPAETGAMMLISQPKMLVLLCSKQDDVPAPGGVDPVTQLESSAASVAATNVLPRTYTVTGSSLLPGDSGRMLAPNQSMNDAGITLTNSIAYTNTPVSANWTYSTSKDGSGVWQFKRWQRGEVLAPYSPGALQRAHSWVLKIKKDLLYSPQDKNPKTSLNAGLAAANSSYVLGTASNTSLLPVSGMVVATQKVEAFDTGTIQFGQNFGNGINYASIDDVPMTAALNILPAGRQYPDSVILGVLQERLLDPNNQVMSPVNGGWTTIKVFYWSSAQANALAPYLATDTANAGVPASNIPKQVVFGRNKTDFNPYIDTWIVPLRDVCQSSAQYRVRFFTALPFSPIGNVGTLYSGAGGVPGKIANPSTRADFTVSDMESLLLANANSYIPVNGLSTPASDSMAAQTPAYNSMLQKVGLNSGSSYVGPGSYTAIDPTVVESQLPVGTVVDVASSTALLSGGSFKTLLSPWPKTQWFEVVPAGGAPNWSCTSPDVKVGVDTKNGGSIITQ